MWWWSVSSLELGETFVFGNTCVHYQIFNDAFHSNLTTIVGISSAGDLASERRQSLAWSGHHSSLKYICMICGPLYQHRLTLIRTWMSNYMSAKMWDEITYPFPNLNGATVEIWVQISNFIPHFHRCKYLSMLGLKLNRASKRNPRPL